MKYLKTYEILNIKKPFYINKNIYVEIEIKYNDVKEYLNVVKKDCNFDFMPLINSIDILRVEIESFFWDYIRNVSSIGNKKSITDFYEQNDEYNNIIDLLYDENFQIQVALNEPRELNKLSKYLKKNVRKDYIHLLEPIHFIDEYPENWIEYDDEILYNENKKEYIPITVKFHISEYIDNILNQIINTHKLNIEKLMSNKNIQDIFINIIKYIYKENILKGRRREMFDFNVISNIIKSKKVQEIIAKYYPEELKNIEKYLSDDLKKKYDWVFDSDELGLL